MTKALIRGNQNLNGKWLKEDIGKKCRMALELPHLEWVKMKIERMEYFEISTEIIAFQFLRCSSK